MGAGAKIGARHALDPAGEQAASASWSWLRQKAAHCAQRRARGAIPYRGMGVGVGPTGDTFLFVSVFRFFVGMWTKIEFCSENDGATPPVCPCQLLAPVTPVALGAALARTPVAGARGGG